MAYYGEIVADPQPPDEPGPIRRMTILCAIAAFAALAGLALVALALAPTAGFGVALIAAPVLGATSLATGTAAAVIMLRRNG